MSEIKDNIAQKRANHVQMLAKAASVSAATSVPSSGLPQASAVPSQTSPAGLVAPVFHAKPGLSRAQRFASRDLDDEFDPQQGSEAVVPEKNDVSGAENAANPCPVEPIKAVAPEPKEAPQAALEVAPKAAPAPDQNKLSTAAAPVTHAGSGSGAVARAISRAERFAARGQQDQQDQQASEHQTQQDFSPVETDFLNGKEAAEAWDDPKRPAGSAYSLEDWLQAEADNPECTIMEVQKPEDRALIAKSRDAMDVILHRSLVIDRRVPSP